MPSIGPTRHAFRRSLTGLAVVCAVVVGLLTVEAGGAKRDRRRRAQQIDAIERARRPSALFGGRGTVFRGPPARGYPFVRPLLLQHFTCGEPSAGLRSITGSVRNQAATPMRVMVTGVWSDVSRKVLASNVGPIDAMPLDPGQVATFTISARLDRPAERCSASFVTPHGQPLRHHDVSQGLTLR